MIIVMRILLIKGTITVSNTETAADSHNNNIEVILRNCAPFTDCINEISNTQIDNGKDIDLVMPM